jgi:hypothetical protein
MAKTAQHTDSNPKTKPGATGFVQDYNEDPGPRQDLNPDAVTDDSVLPEPLPAADRSTRGAAKGARKSRGARKASK